MGGGGIDKLLVLKSLNCNVSFVHTLHPDNITKIEEAVNINKTWIPALKHANIP